MQPFGLCILLPQNSQRIFLSVSTGGKFPLVRTELDWKGIGCSHCLTVLNKVLKGDKKGAAIIQSFSPAALIGFTCLILYKHSKKVINKDKASTVNTNTLLWGAKGEGWRLLPGVNPEKALVLSGQSQLCPSGGRCSITAGKGGTSSREPSFSQGLLLAGFKPFNTLASTALQCKRSFHRINSNPFTHTPTPTPQSRFLRPQGLGGTGHCSLWSIYTMKVSFPKCVLGNTNPQRWSLRKVTPGLTKLEKFVYYILF